MKIALFGATGRVGDHILEKALREGHKVTTLILPDENVVSHERLTVIRGDVRNKLDVTKTIAGADAVVSALRTNTTTTLTEAIPHIVHSMNDMNIKRIVTIGTAGILESRVEPGKLRYEDKDSHRILTFDVEEHHKVYDLLSESGLNWTIVCPTYLPDGEAQENYRVEKNYLPSVG